MWLCSAVASSMNDILTSTSHLVKGVQLEFVINLAYELLCMLVFGRLWVQFQLVDFPLGSDPDLYVELFLSFTKLNLIGTET